MPEQSLPDPFDGLPIVKTEVALKGAGDGLSKALATGALKLHHGQRLIAMIDVEVAGTTVRPLDPEEPRGPQKAKYELKAAGRATFVDESLRADADAMLDKQQAANDEAAGRPQLPMDTPDSIPAELAAGDDPSVPSPAMATDADGYADPEAPAPAKKAAKARKSPAKKAAASAAS